MEELAASSPPFRSRAAFTHCARLAAITLCALLSSCGAPAPESSTLAVSPPTSTVLDPGADEHRFRFELRIGTPGLAVGDRIEIWLFPSREVPRTTHVTLNGGSIEGQLAARAAPRASLREDEPGGTAMLVIQALAPVAAGASIEVSLEVGRFPQQGYGLDAAAQLAMPVRIFRQGIRESIDTARWTLAPERAARLVLRLPSEVEPGDEADLTISLVSAEGYVARDVLAPIEVALPDGVEWVVPPHRFAPADRGLQTARVRFASPGVYRLTGSAAEFSATSNPVWVRKRSASASPSEKLQVYWGDLHNHTRYSFDTRNRNLTGTSVSAALDFARRAARLDFIAITDHGPNGLDEVRGYEAPTTTDMSAEDWARYSDEIAASRVPGLVVFAGFEHLGDRGHTCLVFRERGSYFRDAGKRLSLNALWSRYSPRALLSIPHLHPLRGMAGFGASSEHESLVEIHSKWGSYEFYDNPDPNAGRRRSDSEERAVHDRGEKGPFVRELLAAGKRYGFVGASDHGPPGQYGLTAVLASAPTREAIFDALRARRTWATTGPRTWLEFRVGGATFGEVETVAADDALAASRGIEVRVLAAEPIERIEILRNGEVWQSLAGAGRVEIEATLLDPTPLSELATRRALGTGRSAEYYLRVELSAGQRAWGSPVFFDYQADAPAPLASPPAADVPL